MPEAPVPAPVLLNCWKHHAGYIRQQIVQLQQRGEPALEDLREHLKIIGDSQMDLYIGPFSPEQIARQAIAWLDERALLTPEVCASWLKIGGGYQSINLYAASLWVVRWGEQQGRYVHLHPARYAPDTIRVRAPVLKAAISVLVWIGIYGGSPYLIGTINRVRQHVLGLPLLPNESLPGGLMQIITLLQPERHQSAETA